MAKIPGGVPVAGFISPTDDKDEFPVTDPKYQKGGYRVCSSYAEMQAIPELRREEGMVVYVRADETNKNVGTTYRLKNNEFVKDEVDLSSLEGFITREEFDKTKSDLETTDRTNKEEIDTVLNDHNDRLSKLEEGGDLLIDEETMTKTEDGKLTVKTSSSSNRGVIKVDNKTVYVGEDDVLKAKEYKGDDTYIKANEDGTFTISESFKNLIDEILAKVDTVEPSPSPIGPATAYKLGLVKPDNNTIQVDPAGVISVKQLIEIATVLKAGIVKPDNNTIAIDSTGTIYLKDPIRKLVQLLDVNAGNIKNKIGYFLRVDSKGTGFELARMGDASNKSVEVDVDSETYVQVYDFNKHVNLSISAKMECKALDGNKLILKYQSNLGGEMEEEIDNTIDMWIPERYFKTKIYAKGKGKITIDILSLV